MIVLLSFDVFAEDVRCQTGDELVSGRDRQYLCMYVGIRVPIFVVVVARLGCPIIFLIFCY